MVLPKFFDVNVKRNTVVFVDDIDETCNFYKWTGFANCYMHVVWSLQDESRNTKKRNDSA